MFAGFVPDHTRNATQNPHDYDCLIVNKDRVGIFILSHYKEAFIIPFDDYQVVGSIHGLVRLNLDEKLSLWNPAIRQFKEFTLPPRHCDLNNAGLGFDPVKNDYKVVACYMSLPLRQVQSRPLQVCYRWRSYSWHLQFFQTQTMATPDLHSQLQSKQQFPDLYSSPLQCLKLNTCTASWQK